MPAVNPKILVWARETAGLSLEAAAKAIGLVDSKTQTAAQKLAVLERGEEETPRALLLKMSERYRRSLLVFYLDEPPRRGDRGQDFRTLPDAPSTAEAALLDALIRDLQTRQSLVKSLLEDEEAMPLSFVGSIRIEDRVSLTAQRVSSGLNFDLRKFRAANKAEGAFAYLRNQIESTGIFVLLIGDLGSHHTALSVETFRGFAIADRIAPFVIVNSQDAKSAQAFTALHETVHLWLGTTGISGGFAESRIEKFCNDVAGEILLPAEELDELRGIQDLSIQQCVPMISNFAQERKLSRQMVSYKLYRTAKISEHLWRELNAYFNEEWRDFKKKEKEERKEKEEGGPSYYITQGSRVGPALLNLVNRSISDGILTSTKAGKVLGVKPRNVEPLLRAVFSRGVY